MKRLALLLALALAVSSCTTTPTPTPIVEAPTVAPTQTPQPTYTSSPTNTPLPTATAVPPTATPTATATSAPTSTSTPTATPTIVRPTRTARPVTAPTVVPLASPTAPPPAGMIYPAPKLVQPADGAQFKYDKDNKHGGVNTIVYEWLPVGTLESGKIRCSYKNLPGGMEAAIFDRYVVEWTEPGTPYQGRIDAGQVTSFGTFWRGGHSGTRTWRVAVARICVVPYYPYRGSDGQHFIDMVSPWSEWSSFSFSG
jgi:hypothetical protein